MAKNQTVTEFVVDNTTEIGKINEGFDEEPLYNTASGFSPMTDTGLITNTWVELDTALRNVAAFSTNTKALLDAFIIEYEEKDNTSAEDARKISTPSVTPTGEGDDEQKPGDGDIDKPIGGSEMPSSVVDAIENATAAEVSILLEALISLANSKGITLDELLSNPEYSDEIKKTLEDLATGSELALTLSNLENPQKILESLINEGNADGVVLGGTSDINTTLKYLESVASANNITLEQLLTDPKYADLLKKSLEDLKKENPDLSDLIDSILKQSHPQLVLLSLLNSGVGGLGSIDDIKKTMTYLENIAKENGITLDELLTDPKYADLLKASLEKLKAENPDLADFIDNIMLEVNPQLALFCLLNNGSTGIGSKEQIDVTLKYLENIAKENGITLEQLLTDPKYSDLLKTALENLKKENPTLEAFINLILSQEDVQKALSLLTTGVIITDKKAIEVLKAYLDNIAKENGITLEQLLTDPKYSDLLKNSLKDFAGIYGILTGLTTASPEVIQAFLNQILKGDYPKVFGLNEITVNGAIQYLDMIAKKNGITIEQLLTDPQYSNLLKETLEKFEKALPILKELNALNANELQVRLRSIYNGESIEGLDTEVVDMLREFLDSIAEFNGITTEELLMNPQYAELLKRSMSDFEKIAMFMSTIAKLKENNMVGTIRILYEAVNPKALGLSSENISSIYKKVTELATENNLTVDNLLKNGELLKNSLVSIDETQILRIIYSNASNETIEKVINNICGYAVNMQSASQNTTAQ